MWRRRVINENFRWQFRLEHNLRYTDEEAMYISDPADCVERNRFLRTLPVRHICDAYACVGGDTVQFTHVKPEARVDAVQITDSRENVDRFERLGYNVEHCMHPHARVDTYPMSITDYIDSGYCRNVDFLYLDPPWMNGGEYYTCPQLIDNIARDVAEPLLHRECHDGLPRYLCFKVPYSWDDFRGIVRAFGNKYERIQSMVYHGKYSIHFLETI